MDMTEMMGYLSNNIFSIIVAVYMLIINNKTVKENTEATNKMCLLIDRFLDGHEVKKNHE